MHDDRPTLLVTEKRDPATDLPSDGAVDLLWRERGSAPVQPQYAGEFIMGKFWSHDSTQPAIYEPHEVGWWAEWPREATAADLLAALGLKPSDIGFACDDARFRAERRNDRSSASAARMVRLRAVLARLEAEA
jgi:hypothetical protein